MMKNNYSIAKARFNSIVKRNALAAKELDEDFFVNTFYGENNAHRKCKYCGISESEIQKLISKGKIKTKRLTTRGRTMEVDRIRPHETYKENNIVLSCYWCNNAKTDEFTFDEFKPIAKAIKKTWEKRLEELEKEEYTNSITKEDKLLTDWDDSVTKLFFAFPYEMYSPSNKKDYWDILTKLIDEIKKHENTKDIEIYLVYRDNQKVNEKIQELKINDNKKNKFRIIPNPYLEDVWLRDFMPLTFSNNKALKTIYSPIYFDENKKHKIEFKDNKILTPRNQRKYSFESHMAGLELTEKFISKYDYMGENGCGYWYNGINDEFLNKKEDEILPVILDGGNFIHNGKIGFISNRILTENIDEKYFESENEFLEIENEEKITKLIDLIKVQTNLEKIYILPTEEDELTGHLDGTMRFVNEGNIFIDSAYYERHEKKLEKIFEENKIKIIKIEQTLLNKKNTMSAKGILLNYLRIKDVLFVPEFNEKSTEKELNDFINKCENLNLKVVPVEEDGSISNKGGIFNCISWTC